MKDKNIAVRVEWDTYKFLEKLRVERAIQNKKKTGLSEIVREILEKYVGDTWKTKSN